MQNRYSLHKITDSENFPFSAEDYSYFKYGDITIAEKFGEALFQGFIAENRELILSQEEIVLFPSPYFAIPTASDFLCKYFKNYLNQFLFEHGKNACVEAKIHRNQTYVEDYGQMNFEERVALISNDTYYIDKHFIDGKFCIFLDDIKITGSHEITVQRILKEYNVDGTFFFVYFAELINKEVHPNIENFLNYFAVKNNDDLLKMVLKPQFRFNTRIVKKILLMPEADFDKFQHSIPKNIKEQLFNLAISNNYHLITEYSVNLKQLKN
ncbi:phosphoribosyltransferase family protein [Chryseobacterium echinoideorum]|uniref:phosphoribosyltransferase family protein n=1 Tax=Chryseobacterium echinoideorum TaxID=1549648 RepID=UPI001184F191|nr:phosphoribosyltransferase family protein [Chryseobacterium echinoideorum]